MYNFIPIPCKVSGFSANSTTKRRCFASCPLGAGASPSQKRISDSGTEIEFQKDKNHGSSRFGKMGCPVG